MADEADRLRLIGAKRLGEQQVAGGAAAAGEAREEQRTRGLRHQAQVDEWHREAGRVVGDDHEGDADLVIAAAGKKVDAPNAIYLRTEPEPKNKKDESIYRYDRAGLLMALKTAGAGGGE